MAQYAVTGTPAAPMPARVSAWAVYDVFDVKNDEKVFVGVVSDTQWRAFCDAFNLTHWAADESLAANNDRVARRMSAGGSPMHIMNREEVLEMWAARQETLEALLADLDD